MTGILEMPVILNPPLPLVEKDMGKGKPTSGRARVGFFVNHMRNG
jgi:hypothetical protein